MKTDKVIPNLGDKMNEFSLLLCKEILKFALWLHTWGAQNPLSVS